MNLFRKAKKHEEKQKFCVESLPIDMGSWRQVFSSCLGKMMAIQTACSDHVVKGQDWNVDFSEGSIRFGKQPYPIQFIGSESTASNTWLWGWENINGFSDEILRTAGPPARR